MKHYKYESKGNTQGLEENIVCYWEINEAGFIVRSIEVLDDKTILKYSEKHEADSMGQLPEGQVTQDNLNDSTFGVCTGLSKDQFEMIWIQNAENC
ncbi:hypothetical protein [Paraglaciecola marina]|uniref:hypothetical protein n=1 Tax=Paraglaciecola marina TaxID=2500157 RepID=UPI0010616927|nr:hypothetical protein [Paraglaciecola marina]